MIDQIKMIDGEIILPMKVTAIIITIVVPHYHNDEKNIT